MTSRRVLIGFTLVLVLTAPVAGSAQSARAVKDASNEP